MSKFCNLQAILPNEGITVHNDDDKGGKKTVTKKSNRQSKITVGCHAWQCPTAVSLLLFLIHIHWSQINKTLSCSTGVILIKTAGIGHTGLHYLQGGIGWVLIHSFTLYGISWQALLGTDSPVLLIRSKMDHQLVYRSEVWILLEYAMVLVFVIVWPIWFLAN